MEMITSKNSKSTASTKYSIKLRIRKKILKEIDEIKIKKMLF